MANGVSGDLIIHRVNSLARDVFRAYQVWVDQALVATVKRDSTVRIPLEPGEHQVQIKIDWCSSPLLTVKIDDGSEARASCGPNKTGTGPLRQVLSDPDNYLWLREDKDTVGP
jgi:hypothetical protein